mgnify:CR=1 FL=1
MTASVRHSTALLPSHAPVQARSPALLPRPAQGLQKAAPEPAKRLPRHAAASALRLPERVPNRKGSRVAAGSSTRHGWQSSRTGGKCGKDGGAQQRVRR